ncbi:hypothetical protein ACP70R_041560 [Stipagrostis hirtigluma subsp. patula]
MGSGSFLKVVAKNFDVLAGPLISLAYPLYASVRAIETKNPVDDQQWLTYWWLPFWSYAKLFFNCWLVLPWFNGAAYVYDHFVRPMFVNRQIVNIWYVPRKEKLSKPDDVLSAAERYIEQNGPEAFEKLISKSTKASKSKNTRRSILEEAEAENIAKAERESWGENPFYDKSYRY